MTYPVPARAFGVAAVTLVVSLAGGSLSLAAECTDRAYWDIVESSLDASPTNVQILESCVASPTREGLPRWVNDSQHSSYLWCPSRWYVEVLMTLAETESDPDVKFDYQSRALDAWKPNSDCDDFFTRMTSRSRSAATTGWIAGVGDELKQRGFERSVQAVMTECQAWRQVLEAADPLAKACESRPTDETAVTALRSQMAGRLTQEVQRIRQGWDGLGQAPPTGLDAAGSSLAGLLSFLRNAGLYASTWRTERQALTQATRAAETVLAGHETALQALASGNDPVGSLPSTETERLGRWESVRDESRAFAAEWSAPDTFDGWNGFFVDVRRMGVLAGDSTGLRSELDGVVAAARTLLQGRWQQQRDASRQDCDDLARYTNSAGAGDRPPSLQAASAACAGLSAALPAEIDRQYDLVSGNRPTSFDTLRTETRNLLTSRESVALPNCSGDMSELVALREELASARVNVQSTADWPGLRRYQQAIQGCRGGQATPFRHAVEAADTVIASFTDAGFECASPALPPVRQLRTQIEADLQRRNFGATAKARLTTLRERLDTAMACGRAYADERWATIQGELEAMTARFDFSRELVGAAQSGPVQQRLDSALTGLGSAGLAAPPDWRVDRALDGAGLKILTADWQLAWTHRVNAPSSQDPDLLRQVRTLCAGAALLQIGDLLDAGDYEKAANLAGTATREEHCGNNEMLGYFAAYSSWLAQGRPAADDDVRRLARNVDAGSPAIGYDPEFESAYLQP